MYNIFLLMLKKPSLIKHAIFCTPNTRLHKGINKNPTLQVDSVMRDQKDLQVAKLENKLTMQ